MPQIISFAFAIVALAAAGKEAAHASVRPRHSARLQRIGTILQGKYAPKPIR